MKVKNLIHVPNAKKVVDESDLKASPYFFHLHRLWKSLKRDLGSSPSLSHPFTYQMEVTETATSIERFIQARAEELELDILDLILK
jgi:hypothetical protein